MSAPSTATTDRDTPWGAFCADLWKLMLGKLPELAANIGIDECAKNGTAPLITFKHSGAVPVDPIRGGAGASTRQIASCDKHTIAVECWGVDGVDAWLIKRGLDIALDYLAHGRASSFGKGKWTQQLGSQTAGNFGVKVCGTIEARLAVLDDNYYAAQAGRSVAPTSHDTTIAMAAPDGTGAEPVTLD